MLHTTMNTTLESMNRWQRRRLLRENRGLLARVARQTGRDRSTVCRVFWGKATSRRIQEALERELGLSKEVTS